MYLSSLIALLKEEGLDEQLEDLNTIVGTLIDHLERKTHEIDESEWSFAKHHQKITRLQKVTEVIHAA